METGIHPGIFSWLLSCTQGLAGKIKSTFISLAASDSSKIIGMQEENARDQNTAQLSKSQPCWESKVWASQEISCNRSHPASLSAGGSVAALSCSPQGPQPKGTP